MRTSYRHKRTFQRGTQVVSTESPKPLPTLVLEATAFTEAQLLHPLLPQVALAGRSNVGKSSLINALAGRKNLAKTSATPGKTRSINYYRIEPGPGYIVDLPGYGYAQCSQAERRKWAVLLEHYLSGTPGLTALVLLLDSRVTPQKADRELAAFAAARALPLIPVLTKADKCSKKELNACKRAWSVLLPEELLVTSSQKRTGMEELWSALQSMLSRV